MIPFIFLFSAYRLLLFIFSGVAASLQYGNLLVLERFIRFDFGRYRRTAQNVAGRGAASAAIHLHTLSTSES
jgi:hypothetical protein